MIFRCFILLISALLPASCTQAEPLQPDHIVAEPIRTNSGNEDAKLDWADDAGRHSLLDRQGRPSEYFFQVGYAEGDGTLRVLISGPDALEKTDLFLDVSRDIALDRPVQYTYQEELQAAQEAHEGSANVMARESGELSLQEWRIELSSLGLNISEREPALIGFDVELIAADDRVFRSGQKDNKWLFDRRLNRLIIAPSNSLFGSVSGEAAWIDGGDYIPPEKVAFKRIGSETFLLIVEADQSTGGFRAVLPAGDYEAYALDSRSTQSLAKVQTLSIGPERNTELPPLQLQKPRAGDLAALIPEVMEAHNIRALGFAYIRNGVVRNADVFGTMADGKPADSSGAIFKMASVSKPVAALVVMSLVEAGLWSLDEPLANHWVDPGLAADPLHKELTTRMVLRHLSGLPNQAGNGPLTFLYAPAERQSYSGEGYRYLRRAIEAKFKEPFQAIAQRHLFEPAGIACASFQGPIEECGRYVQKFHNEFQFDPPSWEEADVKGGLMINVQDMQSLLSWVLGGAALSGETWKDITRPNPKNLLLNADNASKDRFGLGWIIEEGKPVILTHGGSEFGARTYMIVIPETQTGLIIATNGSGGLPAIRMIVEATLKQQYPLNSPERSLVRWESFEW